MNSLSSLLSLLAGFLIFCGACYLVKTKRRPSVLAAYLVLLPLPVFISLCGSISGMASSLSVIAASPEATITRTDLAAAMADSLYGLLVVALVSAPTYFVLAVGLLRRVLESPGDSTGPTSPRPESPSPHRNTCELMPSVV